MILDCDLSQIEWRSAAFLSQDPTMIKEIRAGIDQHDSTCAELMELPVTKVNRNNAKIFNFRAIYCNPKTAAYAYYMDPKMPQFSKKKYERLLEAFFEKYSGLQNWHDECAREVRSSGGFLKGPTGQVWQFFKERKRGGYEDYGIEKIYNYPVQGFSALLIKLAMIYSHRRSEHLERKLTMLVHDSLIWDVVEKDMMELARINIDTFQELPDLMKKHFGIEINIPITGEACGGKSWADVKPLL